VIIRKITNLLQLSVLFIFDIRQTMVSYAVGRNRVFSAGVMTSLRL